MISRSSAPALVAALLCASSSGCASGVDASTPGASQALDVTLPELSSPPPVSSPSASSSATALASASSPPPVVLPEEIAHIFYTVDELPPAAREDFYRGVAAFEHEQLADAEAAFVAVHAASEDARILFLVARLQELQNKKIMCDTYVEAWFRGASLGRTHISRFDMPHDKCPDLTRLTHDKP